MQSISVLLHVAKVADVSRTQGVCQMIYMLFRSLGYDWHISGRGAFLAAPSVSRPEKAHPE